MLDVMGHERLGVFGLLLISIILVSSHTMAFAVPGAGTLYGTNPQTGQLIPINPITGVAGAPIQMFDVNGDLFSTTALAADPTDGQMYVGTGNGFPDLYQVNPATGAATFVCSLFDEDPSITAFEDMDFDSAGNLYASVNTVGQSNGGNALVQFDKTDCSIISGPFSFGFGSMGAIAFDSSDQLFGATTGGNGKLYDLSALDGTSVMIGNIDQSAGVPATLTGGLTGLQFDECSEKLFGGTGRGGQIGQSDLVTVNPATGAALVVGAGGVVSGVSIGALAFDGLACIVGGEILSINSASLLVAGLQASGFVLIPAVLSAAGIGVFLIKRKFN